MPFLALDSVDIGDKSGRTSPHFESRFAVRMRSANAKGTLSSLEEVEMSDF
jgi:hypothetical protein